MMKRIVSLLLALMMTLSVVPNTVQAEQVEEIYIEDSNSVFDLVDSGAVTVVEPEQSISADSTEDPTLTNPQESAVVKDIQGLLNQNMTSSNSGTTMETSNDAVLTTRAINNYYWYANATGDLSGNGSTAWSRTGEKSFTGTDIDIVWISPASNLSSSATVAYVDVYKVSVKDGDELQILVDGDAFKSQCPNLTQVVIRGVTDDDMFNVNAGSLLLDGTADVELVIEGSPSYVAANPGNQLVYMDVGAVSLECNYVTL